MYVFTDLSGENRENYDTINKIYSFQKTAYISRDYGIRYYVGPGKWIVGESERQREREKERERESSDKTLRNMARFNFSKIKFINKG